MISGANEEKLELATARMDIMLATNYTPDNPGPLAIIDKYHDKEIERLRKREKKWEKWTTEKEILSTKMSEYLCKWRNIKREYKNQVESNRIKKQEIEKLN